MTSDQSPHGGRTPPPSLGPSACGELLPTAPTTRSKRVLKFNERTSVTANDPDLYNCQQHTYFYGFLATDPTERAARLPVFELRSWRGITNALRECETCSAKGSGCHDAAALNPELSSRSSSVYSVLTSCWRRAYSLKRACGLLWVW